ncbi:probable protein phosphatase 2C 65 [Humulus lupulus]|uniref:probable protein phosphatase 2C 65 n=1 Tax=Humulus lupulus TaxID=3486 RepID=UPI002B40ED4B|nr:probable protein phosphatase 2C 65 [Humulus lupulus]
MGGCCSSKHNRRRGGYFGDDFFEEKAYEDDDEEDDMRYGEKGARIRLRGSSTYTSMYTQQGRKGINQDAMTIWENFTGEKDMVLCGVFDGHGPYGHKVARHVRDNLATKLSKVIDQSKFNSCKYGDVDLAADRDLNNNTSDDNNKDKDSHGNDDNNSNVVLSLSSWEACLIKSFKEMDEDLSLDSTIDSFCSGSTAVTVVKQGDNLIIANLGDSRAILGTRGDRNQLITVPLTVDLKPDIPSEAERIKKCKGRVFAADEEPDVCRIWMPEDDCPGLAMARAFGDFCLKDYGLISIPDVSYRRLTPNDQFVVLATDGIWDALTNSEVVKIVGSAKKRSSAAKMVVNRAVRSWRCKYPGSRVDDCAVVILFFNDQPSLLLNKSYSSSSSISRPSSTHRNHYHLSLSQSFKSFTSCDAAPADDDDDQDHDHEHHHDRVGYDHSSSMRICSPSSSQDHNHNNQEWYALEGVSRVNSIVRLPRFLSFGKRSTTSATSTDYHAVQSS